MNEQDQQKKTLEERLARLRIIPERNPRAAAIGRAKFLSEAAQLRNRSARTTGFVTRRIWRFAMATLLLLLSLFAGGVGMASAARETIPGEFFYPVKILGEDVRLFFTADPRDDINLLMLYTSTRVTEILHLNELDLAIPVRTTERLENHIQQALVLAAGLEDETMLITLAQIRTRLEEQVNRMSRTGKTGDDLMELSRQRIQERIQFMNESGGDPQLFRYQMRFGQEQEATSIPADPSAITSPGDGGKGPCVPGGTDGAPSPEQTPVGTPGSGNGPGSLGPIHDQGDDPDGVPGEKEP